MTDARQADDSRALRQRLLVLLRTREGQGGFAALKEMPPRPTLRVLLSLLSHSDEDLRMGAAMAIGIQVARLVQEEEDNARAREIVRRLFWSLNEESGSSGWGAAEAIGEIMANCEELAHEYAHLLVHVLEAGHGSHGYHASIVRGVLHGIARTAMKWPDLFKTSALCPLLAHYLGSADTGVRGLAVWCVGLVCDAFPKELLAPLLEDDEELWTYQDGRRITVCVKELAQDAWNRLGTPAHQGFPSQES